MSFKLHALIEMWDGKAVERSHGHGHGHGGWRGWGWISGLRRDDVLAARLAGAAGGGLSAGDGAGAGVASAGGANVRNRTRAAPVIPARGFPPDASRLARKVFCLEVCARPPAADAVRAVALEQARDLVGRGVSAWHGQHRAQVTDPRWSAPTWLDAAELARLLNAGSPHPGHAALLAAMRWLESRDLPARVLLWLGPE
ncbi:MAG: hypothetical protein EOP86_20025 [Verrucomicrobiaceae bacterium]|nr:MAG: hypothetical protein EOP86_20025 [Verrucomicrobiaceae bacterium]